VSINRSRVYRRVKDTTWINNVGDIRVFALALVHGCRVTRNLLESKRLGRFQSRCPDHFHVTTTFLEYDKLNHTQKSELLLGDIVWKLGVAFDLYREAGIFTTLFLLFGGEKRLTKPIRVGKELEYSCTWCKLWQREHLFGWLQSPKLHIPFARYR
jgi:hypothetical protein